jgi:hypothetical protein
VIGYENITFVRQNAMRSSHGFNRLREILRNFGILDTIRLQNQEFFDEDSQSSNPIRPLGGWNQTAGRRA